MHHRRLVLALPLVALALLPGCAEKGEAPAASSDAAEAPITQPQMEQSEGEATPSAAATAAPAEEPRTDSDAESDVRGGSGAPEMVTPEPPAKAEAKPKRYSRRPPSRAPQRPKTGQGQTKEQRKTLSPFPPSDQADESANRRNVPRGGDGTEDSILAETPRPQNMYFEHYGTNPTIDTDEERRSTFAVDVDTASFTMARSFLDRGVMPSEAAVRVEEIVNAFDYGYEPPPHQGGKTFSVHAEAAPSPNRRGYHFLHLGVKGKEVARAERKAANLVFVIDVSGSMAADNRLGLVKRSLRLLVEQLEEADKVGIVTYGSEARQVLQPTSAYRKDVILRAIAGLSTEGATNAEAGLRVGYAMAEKHLRKNGINRVVLCSDGVANVGLTGSGGILDTVGRQVEKGITLTSVGFGMGNYNDVLMEQLADKGNGNYHYVDQLSEARRVFVDNLTGTLQVIAKDVKIQVDFDPTVVARYRLIGYENRGLKAHQFDDDRVDAGEIGAGHSVTALYEVRLKAGAPSQGAPLGKVRIRFKAPRGSQSQLVETALSRSILREQAGAMSSPAQLSMAAAQFAERLRGSYWARNVSYDEITRRLEGLAPGLRAQPQVRELERLVEKASELDSRVDKFASSGPVARMDFDRVPVLR